MQAGGSYIEKSCLLNVWSPCSCQLGWSTMNYGHVPSKNLLLRFPRKKPRRYCRIVAFSVADLCWLGRGTLAFDSVWGQWKPTCPAVHPGELYILHCLSRVHVLFGPGAPAVDGRHCMTTYQKSSAHRTCLRVIVLDEVSWNFLTLELERWTHVRLDLICDMCMQLQKGHEHDIRASKKRMETNTITDLLLSLLFWLFVVCCLFLIRMFVVRRFCAFVVFVAFLVFVVCCLRRCCRRCCRRRCCCCRCFGGECAGNFDEFCTLQVKSLWPLFFGGLPFPTACVKTGAFVQAESFFGVKLNYHHSKYETLFQTLLVTETWLQAKQTRHAKRFDGAPCTVWISFVCHDSQMRPVLLCSLSWMSEWPCELLEKK